MKGYIGFYSAWYGRDVLHFSEFQLNDILEQPYLYNILLLYYYFQIQKLEDVFP